METLDLEAGGEGASEDHTPTPLRLLLYAVGAVTVLLIGSLVVSRTPYHPYERLDAEPQPAITTLLLEPDQTMPVALRETCMVRTDHRNFLTVSFWLHNLTVEPVLLAGVQGHPPRGGLRQQGPALSGGTCKRPGRSQNTVMVKPATSRLYTVRWKLPDACPEPYPLEVRVTYQRPGEALLKSGYVTVLVDMGGIGFVQCPKSIPDAFPTS